MTTTTTSILLTLAVSACTIGTDDDQTSCAGGKCDSGVDQSCSDPHYGDGVCQISLSCAVPDIDCFVTFDEDAKAAAWFSDFEAKLAKEENRAPRAIIPETDPRFAVARELLDRGWAAFREHRPVGKLGDKRPGLVLIDDPAVNAFVAPDLASDRSAFVVIVQTGLLSAKTDDDARLGLMMHELQHAVGLHLIHNHAQELHRFYVASGGAEPIGRLQVDDARVRAAASDWLEAASDVGPYSTTELGGLSLLGGLDRVFATAVREVKSQSPQCAMTVGTVSQFLQQLGASIDELDSTLQPVDPQDVSTILGLLDQDCFGSYTKSVSEVVAEMNNISVDMVDASWSPEDLAIVKNQPFLTAITNLIAARRAKMREAEASFTSATGLPWTSMRYFTTEEDADDVSVMVLGPAGFRAAGIDGFFIAALSPTTAGRCEDELGRVTPSYGVDYTDEHHATCWRVAHVRQFADSHPKLRLDVPAPATPAHRLELPTRLADRVMY